MILENWMWAGMGASGVVCALALTVAVRRWWAQRRERQKKRHGAGLVWDQALHKRIDALMGTVDDMNGRMETQRLSVDARIETWAKIGEEIHAKVESLAKRLDEELERELAYREEVGPKLEALDIAVRRLQDIFASVKRENVGNVSDALGSRLAGLETSFFGDRGRHALLMDRVEALETRPPKTKPTRANKNKAKR